MPLCFASSFQYNCLCFQGAKSDGELHVASQEDSGIGTERGYTSDSELSRSTSSLPTAAQSGTQPLNATNSPELSPSNAAYGGWILVNCIVLSSY